MATPGARLLRASRLFSVPKPLAQSSADLSSTVNFQSNTATEPHPTHLTITTPSSSLTRGDWGLKRSLPVRVTSKTSTPLIRVKAIDTYEHITDYASAADHTLNLEKWQELNMPISTPPVKNRGGETSFIQPTVGKGVFEEGVDVTSRSSNRAMDEQRWKFEGPWLAGQTEGEFNQYIAQQVRKRRPEFRKFLRANKAAEDNKKAQLKASETGEEAPAALTANDITDDQLRLYIKSLRHNTLSLFRLIRQFLDLPPAPSARFEMSQGMLDYIGGLDQGAQKPLYIDATQEKHKSNSPYADSGPLKTHPSAGLSYLRSKNHLYNHPVYGPQDQPPPVTARVVAPKNAGGFGGAKLGVAGFVANVPQGSTSFGTMKSHDRRTNQQTDPIKGLLNVDPDAYGGAKVELQVESARIDRNGRVLLDVKEASMGSIAVKKGTVDELLRQLPRTNPRIPPLTRSPDATTGAYGLGSSSVNGGDVFGDRSNGAASSRRSATSPAKSGKRDLEMLDGLLGGTKL